MVEWCAGYGGIHLGLKRAISNLRVIAYGEIEAFACANLVAKMEAGLLDPAPIWTDIKTFPCEEFRDRVDILVAGYPCQPFSAAGKRLGTEDPRHLWPHIARSIGIIRPRMCFFENVEGHISLGLREVVGELEQIGYTTAWGIFSASEVYAPHQRKRVFILAVSGSLGGAAGFSRSLAGREGFAGIADDCCGEGCGELADSQHEYDSGLLGEGQLQQQQEGGPCGQRVTATSHQAWPSRPGEQQHGWEPPRVVANSKRSGGEEPEHLYANLPSEPSGCDSEGLGNAEIVQRNGGDNHARVCEQGESLSESGDAGWKATDIVGQAEPPLGGDIDGDTDRLGYAELFTTCDNRTDELRLLGNGVVPATAERAFRVLMEELTK